MSGKVDSDRGKSTERLAVAALRELGFPHAERAVRTGYRSSKRESADPGDVTGTPGLVWQIKSMRPVTRAETSVPGWMVETEQQRAAAGASLGILVVRRELWQAPRWWAFLPLADLYGLGDGFTGSALPAHLRHGLHERPTLVPVRLELRDVCDLLRSHGFGQPLEAAS